jgi:hypothetical protein
VLLPSKAVTTPSPRLLLATACLAFVAMATEGSKPLKTGAQESFARKYSCPEERVEVKARDDLFPQHALLDPLLRRTGLLARVVVTPFEVAVREDRDGFLPGAFEMNDVPLAIRWVVFPRASVVKKIDLFRV